MDYGKKTGIIFNIQKFSVHDGPGIRTTVFMKGCPLQCRWCSNAESMSSEPELGIIRSQCNNCGKCLDVCPEKAISFDNNNVIQFNRHVCTACGECVTVCSPGALTIYGKHVSVEDVFKEANKDKAFYDGSGGGVTVSGGEPLRQADFVTALFQRCREEGVHTCLDTCGYAATDNLEEVLVFTDYILYDIKHMDADFHRQYTGVSNKLILKNAEIAVGNGIPITFRIPLIEDVNDSTHNITKTAQFLKTLGKEVAIEILPYHRLGTGKYNTLDKPYPGVSFKTPSDEKMETLKKIFEEYGIPCNIGG